MNIRCCLGICISLLTLELLARLGHAAEPPSVKSELRLPAKHPYLTLTPHDVARARERAAKWEWAKKSLENCCAEANRHLSQGWDKLPEKGDTEHWGRARRLQAVGVAYALSGEPRYAEWTRDGLLAYAELYPSLPSTNGRCKVFKQSSLYEAMWLVDIVQAYDLVADSGTLTEEHRRLIETDLLREATTCFKIDDFQHDRRIHDLHYRCYNFQAWHLSAVGLVGLAVKDPALVDYAVHSPYGLRHLIAHDIRDDGLFWERSIGYHQFVVSALLPFTEGLAHCGVDLYGLQVAPVMKPDEDCHYATDVSPRPKSLRLLFESPLFLAFPNLTYPALGDSDRGPLHGGWQQLIGYQRYRSAQLGWLVQRDMPVGVADTGRGRIGFLHYYRYQYRYDDVRVNGQPIAWGRPDATYQVQGQSVLARDGDTSQGDRYLLTDATYADFVLEWTLTRCAAVGPQDRAWVVFRVHPRSVAQRASFPVSSYCAEVNHPYRFRLEARGERSELSCDGRVVAAKPSLYSPVPDWHWLIYDLPSEAGTALDEWQPAPGAFANAGEYREGCSLFPSTGVAVLRQASTDWIKHPDSTAASLSYGPYGGGHGHPDKLNLVVYAQERQWLPDFGSMPYETKDKAEWTAHTISHNTIVVDGISQRPAGKQNRQWPVDTATEQVLGRLERFDPAVKLAQASCDSAYPGVRLQRTVQLNRHAAVDVFDVRSTDAEETAHQFDYVLHPDGDFAESSVPLQSRSGPLGDACGYQHVQQKQAVSAATPVTLTFTAAQRQLRVWIVPTADQPTDILLAEGPTNSPTAKSPIVILRRTATQTSFLTLLEPVQNSNALRSVRIEKAAGKEAGTLLLDWPTGGERVVLP